MRNSQTHLEMSHSFRFICKSIVFDLKYTHANIKYHISFSRVVVKKNQKTVFIVCIIIDFFQAFIMERHNAY